MCQQIPILWLLNDCFLSCNRLPLYICLPNNFTSFKSAYMSPSQGSLLGHCKTQVPHFLTTPSNPRLMLFCLPQHISFWYTFIRALHQGQFWPSGNTGQCQKTDDCHVLERLVLLASSEQRLGMLINIIQCTGQPLPQRIILSKISKYQNIKRTKTEKPCFRDIISLNTLHNLIHTIIIHIL